MNYIELELGEKKRGAKLGLGYLKFLTETKKMTLQEVFESLEGSNALLIIPEFIYLSLKYNAKRKGENTEITEENVMDWIDEDGGIQGEAVKYFLSAFTSSLGVDLGKTQPQAKVAKK